MSTSLNSTLGAVEVGVLLSCILYGVTTVQVYLYSENFKRDAWYLKMIVSLHVFHDEEASTRYP